MTKNLFPTSFPTRELGLGPSRSDRFTFEYFPTLKRSTRYESILGPTKSRSSLSKGVTRARLHRIPITNSAWDCNTAFRIRALEFCTTFE
jgi:hypothetical protein